MATQTENKTEKVEKVEEPKTNGALTIPKRGKALEAPPSISKGRNNDFADAWEAELNQCIKDKLTGAWVEFPGSPTNWASKLRRNFVIDYVTDESSDVQPGAVTRDVDNKTNTCTLYVLIPEKVEKL